MVRSHQHLLEVDVQVLIADVIEQLTFAREHAGALVQVVKDGRLLEVPLGEQGLHDHVHLVLEQSIYGHSCQHADRLLHVGARNAVLLRQQACLYLAEAGHAVIQVFVVVQYEEHLAFLLEVASVGQRLLGYFL